MSTDVVRLASDLVKIPSVNPMGKPWSGPQFLEHQVTEYLANFFRSLGVPFFRQVVEPQRENIVAIFEGAGTRASELVALEAHQDTVPVEGMTIEPFSGEVREGRLWGRGACDIKGGMAAFLGAFARAVKERPANRPSLLMACTVNEELGFTGAQALAKLWTDPNAWPAAPVAFRQLPSEVLVAEPTELNVVVAHKGAVRWRLHTHGRAAHSSNPSRGDSALYRMAKVLSSLRDYHESVAQNLAEHPLVGRPSLSVGLIQGGVSVNTVPDHCVIEIDRRVLPSGDPTELAQSHVVAHVANALCEEAKWITHDPPFLISWGLDDRENGTVAQRLGAAAKKVAGESFGEKIGVPFGTNAPSYQAVGATAVVFGPGSIAQAHTADEWLEIGQLEAASEIAYEYLMRDR